jgi:predicted CXXCH cytochrome family protein
MQIYSTQGSTTGRLVKFLTASAIMVGILAAQPALAGIKDTKHNLGANNAVNDNYMSAGTTEICVFCHTPHASNTDVKAPLWNKPVNGGSFTLYNTSTSSTIDGSVDMGGVSLACLSCHDGSQAMDTMINRPGSGLYNAAGATLGGTWVGVADGKMTGLAKVGPDLTNDHPVGIQYCGGGISTGGTDTTAVSTGTCKDPDFNAPTNDSIGNARVWWVEPQTGSVAGRQKTDIMLYARAGTTTDATNGWFQPWVECASCHDPHSDANATFLRMSNAQSAVCLTCHNK